MAITLVSLMRHVMSAPVRVESMAIINTQQCLGSRQEMGPDKRVLYDLSSSADSRTAMKLTCF